MRKTRISRSLKERIAKEAQHRCGYCHTREAISGIPLTIEHIIPESADGTSEPENLWLACRPCNEFKGAQTHALDRLTGRRVRLFNPRKQKWKRHFEWNADGTRIIGKTACGRVTVTTLYMNHPTIVTARRHWVITGWHPPRNDVKKEGKKR
jgi:hypothetical protein